MVNYFGIERHKLKEGERSTKLEFIFFIMSCRLPDKNLLSTYTEQVKQRRKQQHTRQASITQLTSGCNNETGLENSAKNGTLQNSCINASTFSYCASVMGGTGSSNVGTPGLRFKTK
jgi:hypothetical protein